MSVTTDDNILPYEENTIIKIVLKCFVEIGINISYLFCSRRPGVHV
jgi:hypothetical protein